jgi:hypothetical protein
MLYLVSGASRSGKTIIANKILGHRNIPYMSTDWLMMGFTNGVPEFGIHDRLFPDEIARRIWSFLKATCESVLVSDIDYVIEGEAILPELVQRLMDEYPDKIRICFIGYTDVDPHVKAADIKTHSDGKDDWLLKESDEYLYDHIDNMVAHSKSIKADCEKYAMRYFDTSADFTRTIELAIRYLLNDSVD